MFLYIIGFPSLYGGVGAELYHQIPVWEKLGVKLHSIPTQKNVWGAALEKRGHDMTSATFFRSITLLVTTYELVNEKHWVGDSMGFFGNPANRKEAISPVVALCISRKLRKRSKQGFDRRGATRPSSFTSEG